MGNTHKIEWVFWHDGRESHTEQIGKNDVVKINEHPAQGEGDKWFYDIHYSCGNIKRVFTVQECMKQKLPEHSCKEMTVDNVCTVCGDTTDLPF